MLEDISDLSGHKTPHGKVRQVIPAEAVEAGAYTPLAIPVVRVGCPDCSYNPKYGTIYCKEHRGW